MKILYAGSPLASAVVLSKLIEESLKSKNFEIAGVLTNPPSARGRHSELVPTEVSAVAKKAGIPVFEFEHLMAEAREAVLPLGADLLVSFDYGRIFGPKFLALFPLGGINLHPSALPAYRGCTPVPAAILAGESRLGITVQKLALKTDEGDILAQDFVELNGTETTLSLMDGDALISEGTVSGSSTVTAKGAELLIEVLNKAADCIASEKPLEGTAQSGESSYTPFIKKEDGLIDWNNTAEIIYRQIRAYTPWPCCYSQFNGAKLTILNAAPGQESVDAQTPCGTVLPYRKSVGIEIACGNGTVLVAKELQLQGKKQMDYKSFLNGARNFIGAVLG